ncbi:hypothetical protein ACFLIM_45490 [Nonomuraea sp. M3C6]|uniref:Lipoyl-binding domain-containing protein n=1 Tax=Nonomuraea marmarensis TaxID=3351344 RepID=A0ABW7AW31_9ACTN
MTSLEQIAVPAQDRIWSNEKPQPAQDLAGQRCQEGGEKGPVFRRESDSGVVAELPFEDGDLVAQGEDLGVLVPIVKGVKNGPKALTCLFHDSTQLVSRLAGTR